MKRQKKIPSPLPDRPRVFLVMDMTLAISRAVLRGVRRYLRANGSWSLQLAEPRYITPGFWHGRNRTHGVIGLFGAIEDWEHAQLANAPMVNVSSRCQEVPGPSVLPDNRAIGRRAAEYFLHRGFRHFAFMGFPSHWYSVEREAGFRQAIEEAGFTVHTKPPSDTTDYHQRQVVEVGQWLDSLPRPVAVFTASDLAATRVIEGCQYVQLRVPEQVAVVGVDNDDVMCEMASVPVSSLDPNGEQMGFAAAELLGRLMQGEAAPQEPQFIPPAGIITRESSDIIAVEDDQVAVALKLIRQHACDPINVGDLLDHVTVCRRTLEKRFQDTFGRSLHAEIRRVQFQRAQQMLVDTDLAIPRIATQCGFKDSKRFTTLFHREFKLPPTRYRNQHRIR